MRIPNTKLVIHKNENGFMAGQGSAYTVPVMEHYTTMGKPRLLKIYQSYESQRAMSADETCTGIYLNRFPELDDRRSGSYHELSCLPDKQYYLRFKSCIESERKEFYMDYIEYCDKNVYDNPDNPEDIW